MAFKGQKQCECNHHNGMVPRGLISEELWRCLTETASLGGEIDV